MMIPSYGAELKAIAARALPIQMFVIVHESLKQSGFVVRQDVETHAQRALRAVFDPLDVLARNMIVDKITDDVDAILRAPNADALPHLYGALGHAVCKAHARGVPFETDLLLCALAVEGELAIEPDLWGGMPLIERLADKMDNEARRRGWWLAQEPLPT